MVSSDVLSTTIVTLLVLFLVCGACALDLVRNPCNHPAKFLRKRFLNWVIVALSFAVLRFGRYNMNAINTTEMYNELGVNSTQFGVIISVGSAVYAVAVFINGFVVDKIGGKTAIVIATTGCSICNLAIGAFASLNKSWNIRGTSVIAILSVLYACNQFFQTFCASAVVKISVYWYNIRERGYFSGIFGVVISMGFFFAYEVCGAIQAHLHWSWSFFIPGMVIGLFAVLNFFFVADTPFDAGLLYDPIHTIGEQGTINEAAPLINKRSPRKNPSITYICKKVFLNRIFIVLCLASIPLGWTRDGILAWYPEVLFARFGCPQTSTEYSIASFGTTLGGMFGSMAAGAISDSLFHSRRMPVAFLYMAGLLLFMFLFMFAKSGVVFSILIIFSTFFTNGLNGLFNASCAMDFAGSSATGTAVGFLDGIQKIGSSLVGIQGQLLNDGGNGDNVFINQEDYVHWAFWFLPLCAFACGALLPVIRFTSPEQQKSEHQKSDQE